MNLEELDFKLRNIKNGYVIPAEGVCSIDFLEATVTIETDEDGNDKTYDMSEWEMFRNTGINDVDGNDIYEGDTVHQYSVLIGNTDIDIVGEVKFLEGAWMVVNEEKKQGYPLWNECIENKLVDER